MKKYLPVLAISIIAVIAWWVRFYELDRAAVRSDEINFLQLAAQNQSLTDLWRNPPWQNQIPFADSIAVIWHWLRPGVPDEGTIREPFALTGWLTVVVTSFWIMKRAGVFAAVLFGLWLGLLPFHVYQSREAYYYVVVMAISTGFILHSAGLLEKITRREHLPGRSYITWTIWAILTCHTHMSTWVVGGLTWLILLVTGSINLVGTAKKQHFARLATSAMITGLFMVRWVVRAIQEMVKVSQADGHLGATFDWVGPRVIPFFMGGVNTTGIALSLLTLSMGAIALLAARRKNGRADIRIFLPLSLVVWSGLVAAYLYIGLAGGGVAKISYFTTLLPGFLVWACLAIETVCRITPANLASIIRPIIPVLIAGFLWHPAAMVMRLDGKPVPYKALRSWLDWNLQPGSVLVVDRWYEPWNEMARYAPSNVVVTFTVPDEPYQNYIQLRWREVTQQAIESGMINGFIRLTRNHEERDGRWTWPETYFTRRVAITNDAGFWLRNKGYAPSEDFYAHNTNRLVAEIFFDMREDEVARKAKSGKTTAIFFGDDLRYEKSGPMGIFRFQTQQFMDWRVLEARGELEVYNLTGQPIEASIEISAVAPNGAKLVTSNGQRVQFPAGQMQRLRIGPLKLEPGLNPVIIEDPLWDRSANPLLIAEAKVTTSP